MENKRKSSVIITGIAMISFLLSLAYPLSSEASECRVIRLQGLVAHDSVRAEPETLSISKGTCVIWFNRASANEVKVIFEDGKKCSSVSEAPVGFSLDHESCFITNWIPFGGTSSLRFMEPGTYEYIIRTNAGGIDDKAKGNAKGRIIVR